MALHLPQITSISHLQINKLKNPTKKSLISLEPLNFPSSKPSNFTARATPTEEEDKPSSIDEVSDIGSEIKKAMEERETMMREKEKGFWEGVAEEVREIEWPVFGKVVGTTGVVLGVIAGSSVVLLTVNAVLAELSDRVFAGRGVQDFFG